MTELGTGRIGRRALLGGAALTAGGLVAVPQVAAGPPRPQANPVAFGPFALSLLYQPFRVYDSRPGVAPNGTDPNTGATDQRLIRGASVTVDVSFALADEGHPSGIPREADGVLLNVTCVGTAGASGYLTVWASGSDEPSTSAINWYQPNAIVANSVTTRAGNGYVNLRCGGAVGCSTNVIVDAIGYFWDPSEPV